MSGKPDKIVQYSGYSDKVGKEIDWKTPAKKIKLKDVMSPEQISKRMAEIAKENNTKIKNQ